MCNVGEHDLVPDALNPELCFLWVRMLHVLGVPPHQCCMWSHRLWWGGRGESGLVQSDTFKRSTLTPWNRPTREERVLFLLRGTKRDGRRGNPSFLETLQHQRERATPVFSRPVSQYQTASECQRTLNKTNHQVFIWRHQTRWKVLFYLMQMGNTRHVDEVLLREADSCNFNRLHWT